MCWKKLDNSVQRGDAQSVFFATAFAFFHLALAAAANLYPSLSMGEPCLADLAA